MSRTNNTTNTALAIAFIATAVVIIGGLAVIPATTTTAIAAKPNFWYCYHGSESSGCGIGTIEQCEAIREGVGGEGKCHREPI